MHPNRHDELYQMAATKASREGPETKLVLSKMHQKNMKKGIPEEAAAFPEAHHTSLSKLQNVICPWRYGELSLARETRSSEKIFPGKIVCSLEKAEWTTPREGCRLPEPFRKSEKVSSLCCLTWPDAEKYFAV